MSKTYEALKRAEAERNGDGQKAEGENGADARRFSSTAEGTGAGEAQSRKPQLETWGPFSVISDLSPEIQDQYEHLYTKLVVHSQKPQLQVIMMVGTAHGEGVTTVASLFAKVLAKSRTVLIVDANLRTPGIAQFFKVRDNGGFSDFLARKVTMDAAISATDVPNLFVMTTGHGPLAPPYLFEVGPFDDLLAGLREKFDYVIFDTAPMGVHLDSSFLASRVDGVILVIRAESTTLAAAQEVKKRLVEAGGRVLGVVLSRPQTYVPEALRRWFS